jgi:two-component sensor histidine kinase
MSVAGLHPKQSVRLRALYSYEILDTEREKEFDEIAALAAAICATPIAVINFIDAERQWFKAETGLGVRETPLATSICSHVILEEGFVEIPDTLHDRRMADNPLCCGEPGLRFYAGALLKTAEGLPIGTLCVLDYEPRSLTALQRDTMRVLARQVMAQLDLRKELRTATLLRQEVDHRVKNSLQGLSSYVRIIGRQAQAEETIAALSTINSRIGAIASLHEELYQTSPGPVVDLGTYMTRLEVLFAKQMPSGVALAFRIQPVAVTSAQAIAVGTLVNECIANSLKHAFPEGRHGSIQVTVERGAEGDDIRVSCRDDGVGLSGVAVSDRQGMGMQVTAVIAAELKGKLEVQPLKKGLLISFDFKSGV